MFSLQAWVQTAFLWENQTTEFFDQKLIGYLLAICKNCQDVVELQQYTMQQNKSATKPEKLDIVH